MPKPSKNSINFTKNSVSNIPIPEKGRVYFYDSKVQGLGVMVFSSGTKTFFYHLELMEALLKKLN